MSKAAKVLVTIVILFVFFLLFGAIVGTSNRGRPGIVGLILFVGTTVRDGVLKPVDIDSNFAIKF